MEVYEVNNEFGKEKEIVGFDLGHGESAVARTLSTSADEPEVLDIQGSTSIITAVAKYPDGEVLIGDYAYMARQLNSLRICFKSARLDLPEVREPIRMFSNQIMQNLINDGLIKKDKETYFVVGCPSGWDQTVRRKYQEILEETVMNKVTLVSESRAAFLSARESGSLHISDAILQGAVLIIDIGSSTTDFTAVVKNSESCIDFGSNMLGAGLIDRLIFDNTLELHERKTELAEIFKNNPQQQARCELACRKVKEKYFSGKNGNTKVFSETVKINTKVPIYFEIEITESVIEKVLSKPIESLENTSWREFYKRALIHAREVMKYSPPGLILLTGGASRMDFTSELCSEVFPSASIIKGSEPEFTIARGLALAGRIDMKTIEFRREIAELFSNGDLRKIIDDGIGPIINSLCDVILNELINGVSMEVMEDWRHGKIKRLSDIKNEIETRTGKRLESSEVKEKMIVPIVEWFEKFRPCIEKITNPICDRYHISRTYLSMPSCSVNWRGDVSKDMLNLHELIDFGEYGMIINVIISAVLASICGGSGIALILHGPAGLIIGFIAGLAAMIYGQEKIKDILLDANFPLIARKLVTDKKLQSTLKQQEGKLRQSILENLEKGSESYNELIDNILETIKIQLLNQAEKAELLIK